MRTIGRWPVVVSSVSVLANRDVMGRSVYCKNLRLGNVWRDTSTIPRTRRAARRNRWRAEHARNRAITYHATMADAIDDLVRTETTFYLPEYR